MITYKKYTEKLFESLPRQSTVDQLHRIRDEIKKSQVIKVGPEETTRGGDVGDRVVSDLKKHKMNNLIYYDNPLDRHIDSYETFVQGDSRDSLGYTKDGDPSTHKGTDIPDNKKILPKSKNTDTGLDVLKESVKKNNRYE